jgi:hypothetical protein
LILNSWQDHEKLGKTTPISEGKMQTVEEKIYVTIKKLVKENYPEELLFFETAWDEFRSLLEQLQNKSPESWTLEDCRRLVLPYFPSPGRFEESALFPLMMTISAIVTTLTGEIDRDKIEKKTRVYTKRFGTPASLEPQIVSLLVEASGLEPWEKTFALNADEEGEFGAVTQDGEVPLDSIEDKSGYFIWIDERVPEVVIHKQKRELTRTLRKVLICLLKNYGRRVFYRALWTECHKQELGEYTRIEKPVIRWIADLHDATKGALRSYIIPVAGEGYRFDKAEFEGNKFCVIYHRSK